MKRSTSFGAVALAMTRGLVHSPHSLTWPGSPARFTTDSRMQKCAGEEGSGTVATQIDDMGEIGKDLDADGQKHCDDPTRLVA